MPTTLSREVRNWWRSSESEFDVWDDLRFPASGINPAGQVAPAVIDTEVADFPGTLLFSNSTETMVAGVAQMPHEWLVGSNIKPHIHWAKTTSATGGVQWEFTYRIIRIGVVAGDWSAADNGTLPISHADTANLHAITAFGEIDMTGYSESTMIAWRLYRKTGDEVDNYGANARLFELDFHYQRQAGKRGTIEEYPGAG